ncbi:MAG: radical SAM family heme chaperone HemW [Dehalococcoidales bacterium]
MPVTALLSGHFCYNKIVSGEIALYIHVPFCCRKCRYCSFVSYAGRGVDMPLYLRALAAEMKQRAGGERVRTIYLGGGTPSLLPADAIGGVLSLVDTLFTVDKDAEISMEANPGTVDGAYLATVRRLGINRLSLGVQSFSDAELTLLGRIHTAAQAVEAVRLARDAGFANINLDLIYGLPGQALADWRRSLEAALALAPEHLSLYALTLDEDTPLFREIQEGRLPEIDPDLAAEQYELAEDLLSADGYDHYEISNWARPGRACRHNLVYWNNEPYLGVGVAAHSCLDGRRFANDVSLDGYLQAFSGHALPTSALDEEITPALELAESAILGLRLGQGLDLASLRRRFGVDVVSLYREPIAEMTAAGLLERYDGRLRLTRRGRLLSNEVFWRLLPD